MKKPETLGLATSWADRERVWQRKLGRIRIGVEPIPEQIQRHCLVTWVLTAVAMGIQLMFIALFSAFEHPWIGVIVAGVVLGPVIASSWVGFLLIKRQAERYLREKEEVDRLGSI